jgi:hypothetical protein
MMRMAGGTTGTGGREGKGWELGRARKRRQFFVHLILVEIIGRKNDCFVLQIT